MKSENVCQTTVSVTKPLFDTVALFSEICGAVSLQLGGVLNENNHMPAI